MKKVVGTRAVKDAINRFKNVINIKICKDNLNNKNIRDIVDFANKKRIRVEWVSSLPYKVEAYFEHREKEVGEILEELVLKEKCLIIALDHVQDVGNLGSLIRSAESFGVKYIFISKGASVKLNDQAINISAGASLSVDVVEVNLGQLLERLKKIGFWIYGADLEGSVDFMKIDYAPLSCLILGSEEKGMKRLTREKCDQLIKIPMVGLSNSLNVAVSGGIILAKMMRVLC